MVKQGICLPSNCSLHITELSLPTSTADSQIGESKEAQLAACEYGSVESHSVVEIKKYIIEKQIECMSMQGFHRQLHDVDYNL